MKKLVIGTRGSVLALWQAEHIQKRIQEELGLSAELQVVKTKGDKILDVPLAKIGGKGLFTKELEEMLLTKSIDLAVHSLKDVPVDFPDGLDLACITEREDVRDCFLSHRYIGIEALPKGAKVGTTSLRRSMQIKAMRPDIDTQSLRGNIQTRLKKLENGEFDAIILASAGVKRLGISTKDVPHIVPLSTQAMIPAMGQGALGIEACKDSEVFGLLKKLSDSPTAICCGIERAFVRALEGGCQVPIGVNAFIVGDEVTLRAVVGLPDGTQMLKDTISGGISDGEYLAQTLAGRFIQKGAKELLAMAQKMAFGE
ncbi:hydroxymethylbilane synthase [Helicobacter sp. 11S02596-1]|uniref:hydroxymethylbilane synthase n=1 Tax=Helicobacter sp. 11S02596-1 TaxID=1476194 RepID=UPI000BA69A87|nr:hydroxymethylbilane synthase [Helicobacter sp. 11S02596-1]PAF41649.1 hydroxymethylbilane synthase [Helicobacter sp. 11S02596-1]